MITIESLRNKIKEFTQRSPNISDSLNPQYKEYLAKCSKLLEYDFKLSNLSRENSNDEYYIKTLNSIEKAINRITQM